MFDRRREKKDWSPIVSSLKSKSTAPLFAAYVKECAMREQGFGFPPQANRWSLKAECQRMNSLCKFEKKKLLDRYESIPAFVYCKQ